MNIKSIVNNPTSVKSLIKTSIIASIIIVLIYLISYTTFTVMVHSKFRDNEYIMSNVDELNSLDVDEKGFLIYPDKLRLPEVRNHVRMFHDSFWTFDKDNYEENIQSVLPLGGKSIRKIYNDLLKTGYFDKMTTQSLSQKLKIKKIRIKPRAKGSNFNRVRLFGLLVVKRSDQRRVSIKSRFIANFNVVESVRTDDNPHGLLIKNYEVKMIKLRQKKSKPRKKKRRKNN